MNPTRWLKIVVLVFCGFGAPVAASAQSPTSGVYVAGAVFADVREFATANPLDIFGISTGVSLDATGFGGSMRVGTWLHSQWTLELGLDLATTTTVGFEDDVRALIFPAPTPTDLSSSSDFTTVTATVGFHPSPSGRLRLGYRGGIAFAQSTYRVEFADVPRILNLRAPRVRLTEKQNFVSVALGVEAAIRLTDQLSLVPELRAMVLPTPQPNSGVFLIRPAAGMLWNF